MLKLKKILEYIDRPTSALDKYIKNRIDLSREEENKLIEKYNKSKDSKALDILLKSKGPYIAQFIWKYKKRFEYLDSNITFEEAFNMMVVNFLRALNTFDPEKGKFITHLRPWLEEVGKNPSKIIGKLKAKHKIISIDKPIKGKDKDMSLADLIKDPKANIERQHKYKELFKKFKIEIEKLPEKQKAVIKVALGFDPEHIIKKSKIKYADIAKELDMKKDVVGRQYLLAIKNLKKALKM